MENFTLLRSNNRTNKTKQWLGLLTFCIMLLSGQLSFAQFQLINNVDSNPTGWTLSGFSRSNSSFTPACEQSYHYYRNFYSYNPSGTITSPNLTGASNGEEIAFSFSCKANEWSLEDGVDVDLFVEYSTDNSTWIQVGAPINISGIGTTEQWSLPCTTFSGTIPAGTVAAGSDFKFRIRGQWNSGDGRIGIDQISVIQQANTPPNCATSMLPANQATDVVLNPTLSWSDGGGTPTSYDIYLGTSANPPFLANVTSTTYMPQAALAANTTYFWKVVPKNNIGDALGCIEQTFTTGTNLVYCTPSGASNNTDEIINFTLNNLNNDSAASEGTAGYKDYTSSVAPAIILTDVPNVASLTSGSGSGNHGAAIWIDFNQNGTFEASEKVTFIDNIITPNSTVQFPEFTVTSDITPGIYRLRVQYRHNNSGEVLDPCVASTYSETEDYLVEILPAPSCFPPSNLSVVSLTFNSATIAWSGDASLFDIEYGVAGFTPTGNPTPGLEGISGNTYTITGLEAETNYQFYVRQNCGDGDLSIWAGPFPFYTGYCLATSTGTGNRITGVATTGGFTNIDNLNNGTSYGYTNYANDSNQIITLSEGITFSYTITVPANTVVDIWIDMDQNLIFDPIDELLATHDALTTTYTGTYTIPMGMPLGDYRMRIRSRSNSTASNPCGSLGNGETEDYTISVIETPSCLPPSDLAIDNITYNAVDFSWFGPGSSFEVIWGETGFDPASEGTLVTDVVSGVTISGFSPLTSYQMYVRQNCGDEVSLWAGPIIFTTPCGPLTPPTATQDFTGFTGSAPATLACWSEATGTLDNQLTGTTSTWTNQTYNYNINSSHPNGTAAYINLYGTDNEWLITPAVDLGDGSMAYQMEYDVSITPYSGTGPLADMGEKFVKVVISTDGGETWSSANVLHTYDNNDIPAGGREEALSLTGYSGIVKFAFYAYSTTTSTDTDARFYIDNWRVVPVPTCPKPTFLSVADISYESAVLTWTSDGSSFDIEYGPAGFTPTGNPSAGLEGVSNPYTLTGLEAETNYQYYVRQNCGDGDFSTWAGPFSFYTGYCLATSTGTGNRITGVATTGGFTNIDNLNNGTSYGYTNYANDSNQIITLSEGITFSYTITVPANTVVDIWIDMDQNLIFDPIDELLVTLDALTTTYTGTYTIPMGMPLGDYRMRIRSRSNSTASNPCGSLGNGETEDYTLRIVETPSCFPVADLGANNITYNSAELFWTSDEGTSFDIEIAEAGFTPTGEPTPGLIAVSNPYIITGLTPLTEYQFYVRQNCGAFGQSIWVGPFSFKTECQPPVLTETTDGQVCGMGQVTLSATTEDGASIAWFDSLTSNTKVGVGNTFTTPVISETTSYWAAAFVGTNGNGGRPAPNFTSGAYTTASNYGLVFTAHDAFTLNTVDVYLVGSAGNLVLNLTDSTGAVLDTRTIALPALGSTSAPQVYTIDVNFDIEPGDYRLVAQSSPNMVRESAVGGFPYEVGEVATITNGYISGTSTNYYYFYNWSFTAGCFSERTEVVATVTSAPELELSTYVVTICDNTADSSVTIVTGDDQYDTFIWEPANNVSGDATSGWSFTATESTVYTLTASNSVTGCATQKDVSVFVGQAPELNLPEELTTCEANILEINSGVSTGIEVFINETFSDGTSFPAGWYVQVGSGDAIAVVNANTAGGTPNQVRITGNSQSNYVTNRVYYGPINTQGLQELTLEWNNYLNHYSSSYNYSAKIQTSSDGVTWNDTDWVYSPVTAAQPASVVSTVINTQDVGSTTFYVSFTLEGQTFGMHNWNIDNVLLTGNFQYDVTWSPINNLFIDAEGTIPYTEGTNSPIVYFMSENAASFNYTATAANDLGCEATSMVTVTVNPAMAAPTGDTTQTLENGDTLADLVVNGTNLVWYADADLTQVIPNSTAAVDGTTYYVVATTDECQSEALAITVTVIDPCANVITPTGDTSQTLLIGQTLANLTVSGDNLVWYADAALTTVLPDTTVAVDGTTYYVVSETGDCQSEALAITVTVIDPCADVTAPTGDTVQTVADGSTLADLTVNGTNLSWFEDADLTQSLPATTVVENGTTYYVASVTDVCVSEALAITVYIEGVDPCDGVTVPAPTGEALQTVSEGTTLADLVVDGENLQWYADADLTQELDSTTVVEDGVTYYVTQTIGVCTSAEALAVTVQVTVGREDFDSFAFRFYPNPVGDVLNLTSNSEISNIDLFNMLGQKVTVVANANNTQVDMSALPTGNYIISITIEGVTKTFKVVKK